MMMLDFVFCGPPRILCLNSTTRLWSARHDLDFWWDARSSLERFLITLILCLCRRTSQWRDTVLLCFPPVLYVCQKRLNLCWQISSEFYRYWNKSFHVRLILFFCEHWWLLLARTTAASATCWHCFRFCWSSLIFFVCAENFSRSVSNSIWNPLDISFVWCSNSFYFFIKLWYYFVCHTLC